jgi:ubiquinone/menaquinone biosynthesis C-methylase UbiE
MRSATELKQIFQAGWNIPSRVENYTRGVAEFTDGETHAAWRETLTAALGTDRTLKVLDVGTGPGIFACLYAQMGHDATGLDFSERMLAVARRRAAELGLDCEFVFGDAEEPPFETSTFDAVSSRHVLFNLPRPGVAVREWARVLKPGGRMILMGNEHGDQPTRSLAASVRQMANWSRMRWATRRHGRHSWATPDYRQAVSECPLFRHGSGTLRAVMEAAGLQNIRLQSTEAIQAARRKTPRRKPKGLFMSHQFFMLVGEKP